MFDRIESIFFGQFQKFRICIDKTALHVSIACAIEMSCSVLIWNSCYSPVHILVNSELSMLGLCHDVTLGKLIDAAAEGHLYEAADDSDGLKLLL